MTKNHSAGRALTLAATAVFTLALSACGGGSNAVSDTVNTAVMPTLAAPKSCTNIAGQLDPVQTAVTTQLRPAVLALPTIGASAAGATTALAQTLDTVDALSNALTTLARTQNPQQFTSQLGGAGDSILCSSASLSDALALLATAQTAPIPGLSTLQQTLATATQRVADGLVGTAPGGDLTVLTNQLVTLANQLAALSGNLPPQLNQPYLAEILALNATAFRSLALILGDVGALNGTKLATDVTALLLTTTNTLQGAAVRLGVPSAALTPVTTQLNVAVQTVGAGLGAVAAPTLQAVSAVLGGVSSTAGGTAAGSFSDLLDGALAGGGSTASLGRVTEVTQQLGGAGGVNLLSALLQSFGGILPR